MIQLLCKACHFPRADFSSEKSEESLKTDRLALHIPLQDIYSDLKIQIISGNPVFLYCSVQIIDVKSTSKKKKIKKAKQLLLPQKFSLLQSRNTFTKNYLARVPETFRIKLSCMRFIISLPVLDIIHPVFHFRFRTGLLYLSREKQKYPRTSCTVLTYT